MRIGVLSDTHAASVEELPPELVGALRSMDLILHAGDYTGRALLEALRRLGNFRGVYGNMDPPAVKAELPEKDILVIEGKRIGLIHGYGPPFGLEERLRPHFPDIDVLVYGHSHLPKNQVMEAVLYFNPGSARGVFPAPYRSYGLLTLGKEIKGEIIRLG